MSKLNSHKPIPYALSTWDSRTEMFYKCCACGQDFRMFGNRMESEYGYTNHWNYRFTTREIEYA